MSVKEKGKKQDSKKPSRIDQEDVERRLLNETIDEVVGIRVEAPETQPQDPYSWINTNIEERLLQSNLIQNGFKAISPPSFASKVQNAIAITLSPPSLNRNQLEAAELELPEATNEIISELGFYTTSIGRELYNKINNVETPIQPVYELEAPNMEIPVEIGVIPNLSAETPAIPPTSPQILDLNLHTEIDKTKTPQISRINTRLTHATPQVATADAQETSSIYYQSALEAEFEKIALEIEAQKKTEPKPLRVNRKKTQRAKTPELIEIEPMNKPLKYHKRKPLVPRDIEVRIPLHFETEYDKKDYQPDDPYEKRIEDEINIQNKNQPAQISAMELEFQPSEIEPEPVENIRDILGFDSEPQQTVSHLQNQTPQLSPARQALNLNSPTPSFLLSPRRTTFSKPQDSNVEVPHPKRPRLEISQSSTHHQSIPHQVPELDFSVPIENQPQEAPFNPRLTSTALRKPLSQQSKPRVIAKHDLEFAKWHQKSKTSLTTSAEFTPSQKVLQSKKTGNSEEFDENGDHLFHSFKGKYDTMIKFVGKNGKIACCSNFSMEV